MSEKPYSNKSIKLTAAVYATRKDVVDYVREHGHLPEKFEVPGGGIAMRVIMKQRGIDLELNEREKLVYDAILRDQRVPGGSVHLVEDFKETESLKKSPD